MMEEKVLEYIRRHDMFAGTSSVILGLSGGADSVALFYFLLSHRRELGISVLMAAHLNHGLRGAESDRDAVFVQQLCEKHGIKLFVEHANMARRQAERPARQGTEAWGRSLRYAWFEELAAQQEAKVATAHTRSDNAETVLFRAVRGSGPRGLAGIPPMRGVFVRPLLCVGRRDVEDYCRRHGLAYVEDSSNADPAYSRNRLRRQVLPVLEEVHPGAEQALARMAQDMEDLSAWLNGQAEELLWQAGREDWPKGETELRVEPAKAEALPQGPGAWRGRDAAKKKAHGLPAPGGYDAKTLLQAPQPLRLAALSLLAGPAADRAALGRLEGLLAGNMPVLVLPGGQTARLQHGRLNLYTSVKKTPLDYAVPFRKGRVSLPSGDVLDISVHEISKQEQGFEKKPQKSLTFFADYDRIMQYDNGGVLRHRRPGDRYAPPGRGISKPLRKWMNEERIDPLVRDSLPLLAAGSRVLWVAGGGFGQEVVAGPGTRFFLEIAWNADVGDEGDDE